ncbi:MAG TPA: FtsX-like permease family protein [Nocardioides sp.]|nr:FtsX-like permease family protein [Nocardioides sp.]
MAMIRTWLRWDVRRRWRSLVVLVLLTAGSGAVVLTAAAGAHRGVTAPDRIESATLAADAFVLPNSPDFDWDAVRRLPYVTAVAELAITDPLAVVGDYSPDVVAYPPVGADDLFTVERPVVLHGRMLDPDAVDEVVVTPGFLSRYGDQVGDHLTLALPAPREVNDDNVPADQLHGPRLDVRIVGVIRSAWNYDLPGRHGLLVVSPAVAATYPRNILGPGDPHHPEFDSYTNAQVRLAHGAADIPQLRQDLQDLTGRSDIDVWDIQARDRVGRHRIDFESACLAGFAGAALLAALFLVGQAIGRHVAYGASDLPTAMALGATPGRLALAGSVGPVLAAGSGLVLAVAASVVASRWFPIGSAALVEPDPGVDVDVPVLVGGSVLLLLVAALLTTAAAARAVRSATADRPARRSRTAAAVAGSGLPVPLAIGTRFALEAGRGRSAVPVRPALVGAVVGVLGTTGVLVFDGAITDAIDNPERFGQTATAVSYVGFQNYDYDPEDRVKATIEDLEHVTGVASTTSAIASNPGGTASVQLFTDDGDYRAVVLHGRMPVSPGEVALAPDSLEELGVEVGDPVDLTGDGGSVSLRVVGEALTPEAGGTNSYHDGGWVTTGGWDRLFDTFIFRVLLISTDDSAGPATAVARLREDVAAAMPGLVRSGLTVEPVDLADRRSSLEQVRALPRALGAFLVLLSVGALGHALAMAVRRRSSEIAVLRALGLTPRQTRGVVTTHATVIMLVGLVAGIPLGIAAGRTLWRPVAAYTPLQYAAPTPLVAILLVVPAALVTGVLLAVLPARRAARTRAAAILRAE